MSSLRSSTDKELLYEIDMGNITSVKTNQEQIRSFVALELPENAIKFLDEIAAVLKQSRADVRWTRSGSVHVTLKFLGNIEVSRISDVKRAIDPVFRSQEPFVTAISGLGVFPNLRRPRVIWAGFDDSLGHLGKMAGLIDRALENLGFESETRSYNPHLTLGRTRSDKGKDTLVDLIRDLECKGPSFEVDRATLFQSILSPTGPRYSPISIFNFGKKTSDEEIRA
jgi:RNA 2',3'-cyclic 3'-phosphodiesterase